GGGTAASAEQIAAPRDDRAVGAPRRDVLVARRDFNVAETWKRSRYVALAVLVVAPGDDGTVRAPRHGVVATGRDLDEALGVPPAVEYVCPPTLHRGLCTQSAGNQHRDAGKLQNDSRPRDRGAGGHRSRTARAVDCSQLHGR